MCFSFLKTLVFATRKSLTFGLMASGKGGRPRLPAEEKKKFKVSILLTETEQNILEANYKASGYRSQSKFVLSRIAVPGDSSVVSPAELVMIAELRLALSEVLDQLRHVGTNFNQLVHLAQSKKEVPPANDLAEVVAAFGNLEAQGAQYLELIQTLKSKWSLK